MNTEQSLYGSTVVIVRDEAAHAIWLGKTKIVDFRHDPTQGLYSCLQRAAEALEMNRIRTLDKETTNA